MDRWYRSLSSYMDTFGNRLTTAMQARGIVAEKLAEKIGLKSKQAIYNLIDGTTNPANARTATINGICRALRIRKEWLETGRGAMDDSDQRSSGDDEDWGDIRAYRQAAALGDGAVPDDYAETYKLKFRAESLRRKKLNPEKLGVVYGRGDSMLPRIHSGDAIMFDMRRTDPEDGALFVVSYDGNLMAKQLVQLGGRWFIDSLNKDDPKWRKPIPIDEHNGFAIHGRVVWIGSWED